MQDAYGKSKKTGYFNLTLPNTKNELKMAAWASGTPTSEQFLLHICTLIYSCKQMVLDATFKETEGAVESAWRNVELTSMSMHKSATPNKRKRTNGSKG